MVTTLIQPSAAAVRVSSFCPDSSFLATAGDDEEVCLWDISTGDLVRRITDHEATVFAIAFSPDGNILVTTDCLGRVRVWASLVGHSPQLTWLEEAHDLGVNCVTFSPSHEKAALTSSYSLVTCGNDGELAVWSLTIGPDNQICLNTRTFAHEGAAMAVAVAPDGHRVASSGGDKLVKLWALAGLQCLQVLEGHTRYVSTVAFSPTGRYLASGSNDKTVRVWLVVREEETAGPGELEEELYTNNRSENYYQVQLARSQQRRWQSLTGHQLDINTCDMLGDSLATGSNDSTIRLWRYQSDQEEYTEAEVSPLLAHSYSVYSLRFSRDGAWLVSGSLDGSVKVWDVETGRVLHSFRHNIAFRSVVISEDKQLVAGGSDDNNVHVWNISSNTAVVLRNHENTVFSVSFSPDSSLLVSGCSGGSLVLWTLSSMKPLDNVPDAHDLGVTGSVFRSDQELFTAGNDAQVKIWRLNPEEKTLECLQSVKAHSTSIMCLWLSRDVDIFVTTSGDKTGKVWSCQSLRCLATLGPCASYVTSGALNWRRNLFAASVDRSLVLYRVELAQMAAGPPTAAAPPNTRPAARSAEQSVLSWSAEDVRQWAAALGVTMPDCDIGGAKLAQSSQMDLVCLGLTDDQAEKIVAELKLVCDDYNEIPAEFVCPITCDLMSDPVQCSDGFVYEKSAIKEWLLTRRNTSPMTNLEMTDASLIPCDQLKLRIDAFNRLR